jgi:hypothetical protein
VCEIGRDIDVSNRDTERAGRRKGEEEEYMTAWETRGEQEGGPLCSP